MTSSIHAQISTHRKMHNAGQYTEMNTYAWYVIIELIFQNINVK